MGARIFFAPGRFQPDQPEGSGLLAHELTHVMQQRVGPMRMALKSSAAPATAQAAADEAEAEATEARVRTLQQQGSFAAPEMTLARAPSRGQAAEASSPSLGAPDLTTIASPDGPLIARAVSTHFNRDLPGESGAGPVQVSRVSRAIGIDEVTVATGQQTDAAEAGPSVDEIADRVYQKLKDRLSLERERRGRWL
jgi:hypothetical protein